MFSVKKVLARILIISLIICNNGFFTLADSVDSIVSENNTSTEQVHYNISEQDDTSETDIENETKVSEVTNDTTESDDESTDGIENSDIDILESESDETTLVEETEAESDDETSKSAEENETQSDESVSNLLPLEEIKYDDNISTDSEFERLLEENIELVEYLRSFNITVDSSATIKFFKELELREDGEYLTAKLDGHWYLADDRFSDTYNPYKESDGLFGADTTQKIILDFGANRPTINKSNNWNNTVFATENPQRQTIEFEANGGTIIKDWFQSTYTTSTFPIKNFGSIGGGDHIELPTFGDVWNGFEFKGWLDEEGVNLTTSQNNCFGPIFQYGGEVTYTASWERVTTETHNISISYFRSTYSSAFSVPYN